MPRKRALQLHLGSVSGGPNAELLFSIVADEGGAYVQVFAHDPAKSTGGTLARLNASEWRTLKALVSDVDEEIASNHKLVLEG